MRPSKELADRLFEQYWLNVHPISRIVHKSSLVQLYQEIYTADQSTQLPNSAYALVFTSLFAGLVSMDWETYTEHFKLPGGDSKTTRAAFEDNMQRLTETVLGYCSLAHTKDLRALQALVAYLVSVQYVSNLCADIYLALTGVALCSTKPTQCSAKSPKHTTTLTASRLYFVARMLAVPI